MSKLSRLKVASNFALPLDLVTESQAILAIKGAGKTYTAGVQAEEMLKANIPICVIDPTGAWWGLKSSADGKSAGFPIPIFGGEHADAPLNEDAGELVARAMVENRFSAVFDLSLFRKGAMRKFMTAFIEILYHKNREALHVFIDEADLFAPQNQKGMDARLLGAIEDLVRRGRVRGLGSTLITQRSAALHKDVLTQCETLCVLRMTHPRDIEPIREWVAAGHGSSEELNELVNSLPNLPRGTAWFWSPNAGIFRKVEIRKKTTFNSSATPKPGERVKRPKTLAEIDLEQLGEAIKATAQRAKENDPAALKRRIAELERDAAKPAKAVAPEAHSELLKEMSTKQKEQARTISALRTELEQAMKIITEITAIGFDGASVQPGELAGAMEKAAAEISKIIEGKLKSRSGDVVRLQKEVARLAERVNKLCAEPLPEEVTVSLALRKNEPFSVSGRPAANGVRTTVAPANHHGTVTNPQARILAAAAQFEAIGRTSVPKKWIAALAGVSHRSSSFGNNVSALRTGGYISYPAAGEVALTDAVERAFRA